MWQKFSLKTQEPLLYPVHKNEITILIEHWATIDVFRLYDEGRDLWPSVSKFLWTSKCLIHTVHYARGSRRKKRSEPWLVCGRGEDGEARMVIPLKRGNEGAGEWEGKLGEQERFPKLIKCSTRRKLPANIAVPLDKLAHCSPQFLCCAEVASWGHHWRVRGMVGAINSECFCARWFVPNPVKLFPWWFAFEIMRKNCRFACRHYAAHLKWPSSASTLCFCTFTLSVFRVDKCSKCCTIAQHFDEVQARGMVFCRSRNICVICVFFGTNFRF